jgi:hypothetical protein
VLRSLANSDHKAPTLNSLMPVRLRGHHFLCVLTYRGAGYTPAFVANMTATVEALREGAPVQLVEGPDDICNGFTDACRTVCDHDCSEPETQGMDRSAADAVARALGRDLTRCAPLSAVDVSLLRAQFKQKTIRAACADCSWKEFCDSIADSDFAGAVL